MITLEQNRRLKVAGYEFNPKSEFIFNHDDKLMMREYYNLEYIHLCKPCASEKEMIDYITNNTDYFNMWKGGKGYNYWIEINKNKEFIGHDDFTECLVQACVVVLKGVKK